MFSNKTSIFEYYDAVLHEIRREIFSQTDRYILSVDVEQYAEFLFDKYSLLEIVFDESRDRDFEKTSHKGYLWVHIRIPVIENEKISEVLELQPTSGFTDSPPPMEYYDGYILTKAPADPSDVQQRIDDVLQEVRWRNNDIQRHNIELKGKIREIINSRIKRVKNEDALLEEISKKVAVPLRKKSEPASMIPTSLRVKKSIQPIMPPKVTPPVEFQLERDKFHSILELIDNCCRMFERTPPTFSKMKEEELRNVILSNLNGVFEGGAVGEAFSKLGKTDIYLNIEKGQIFVAECKYWKGPKTIEESAKQILNYLTWRNSYGVVVLFSRNKGFSDVIDAVSKEIERTSNYVKGFEKMDETHFRARHSLPEDDKKLIEIHFVVYNLYVERRN